MPLAPTAGHGNVQPTLTAPFRAAGAALRAALSASSSFLRNALASLTTAPIAAAAGVPKLPPAPRAVLPWLPRLADFDDIAPYVAQAGNLREAQGLAHQGLGIAFQRAKDTKRALKHYGALSAASQLLPCHGRCIAAACRRQDCLTRPEQALQALHAYTT